MWCVVIIIVLRSVGPNECGGLAMYRSKYPGSSGVLVLILSCKDASTMTTLSRWCLVSPYASLGVPVADPDACDPERPGMSSSLALPPLIFRICDCPNLTLVARWMGDSSIGV